MQVESLIIKLLYTFFLCLFLLDYLDVESLFYATFRLYRLLVCKA